VLAYRTENANRIKRKEKTKMDVLNIVINPSEKAERGNCTALPEVPPGAAPGEDTRAGRARPEPSALPQCDWPWRNRTSSSTLWSVSDGVTVFFEFDGVHLWNLKTAAVRAANGKQWHKHDDALCVMILKMHRTLLGMPFRTK
jgi:hypothetical protein